MINNSNFLEIEIPEFNPISQHFERLSYWKDQKRRCIEGYWVSGKWMPGVLYFYVNFWNIQVSGKGNLGKQIGRPWLRDLEWEKAYIYMEAKGFSGFEGDTKYTCNRLLKPENKQSLIDNQMMDSFIDYGIVRPEDLNKEYRDAREYLRAIHPTNLGKPLFQNEAKNVLDLEARETGKSYWASAMIAHNFLFDGAYDYDIYMQAKAEKNYLTTQTVVGSIDTKYSKDLLDKFGVGFEHLPGKIEYKGIVYHSPLTVETDGSLASGKTFRSKENDIAKSTIKHVTFKDNPLAANGTRPSFVGLEEVGFMTNIEEALGALKECVSESGRQFGTIYMFGTGGLVKGIALNHVKNIFYHPEDYNCLSFDDIYEGRGKTCFFVPKHLGLNQFKEGENKITNWEKADKFLSDNFIKLKDNKYAQAMELINNPRVPSHMFYTVEGMFFPTIDLKEALGNLETDKKILNSSLKGFLTQMEDGTIEWRSQNVSPIREYPFKVNRNSQGCIEIFETPIRDLSGNVPSGVYYAGCDPVDDDDLQGSLQSTFIINKLTRRIVAEYTARHETAKEYWENLRRLLIYYNAKCNFENQKKGIYQYFENKNSLYLLAETPKILKQVAITSKQKMIGNKNIGTPASKEVNQWARNLINEWLKEDMYGNDETLNLFHIKSPALLQELITWNPEANFDRISALGMTLIILEDRRKIIIDTEKKIETVNDKINNFLNPKMNYGTNIQNISLPKIIVQ
jgi:hypothetical protein